MGCLNLCRYKCEYGPQDYSRIVKPITEDLLPKPKKKPCAPDAVPEGNVLAPTRKARAKRAKGLNVRKPLRKFKSISGVTFSIPDLNVLPSIDDPLLEPAKIVKKRQPRKKLIPEPAGSDGAAPMVSVTGSDISTKTIKKRGPRKKLIMEPAGSDGATPIVSVTGSNISTKTIKKRCPRKKKDDGIGFPLSALCDTGMGSNCPSLAHGSTCAYGEEVIGEVLNPEPASSDGAAPMVSVTGSDISTKTIKKRGPRKKKGDGIGFPLSALCDTGLGSNCPSLAHGSTCAYGEEVIGEVLNPDTAQTEGVGVDVKEEVQPVKKSFQATKRFKKNWGASVKRGCLAQFTVKTFLHLSHVSEICIIQEKHVNCDGLVVHGGMKVGDRSAFSAHLSPEIRSFVEECLRRKDTSNQIMKKHLDLLKQYQAKGREITRDLLLTTKDIRNISGKLAQESYMLHKNDAQSVRMWVQKNSDKVFYYTESNNEKPIPVPGELTGQNMPFTIGIQTPWQKEMMLEHGHRSGISVDATFETNEKKVCNKQFLSSVIQM